MAEFLRVTEGVTIRKLQRQDAAEQMAGAEKGRMLRLYCSQHGQRWQLQVRGPMGLAPFGLKDGQDFVVAGASLGVEDLQALRDAINAQLGESGK